MRCCVNHEVGDTVDRYSLFSPLSILHVMGFYPQSNKWQCGPFALKHALAILGQFVDERALTRAAKSTRSGTDERMLRRAAKRFECELVEIRKHEDRAAYKALTAALNQGRPCLICINQWGHWVTIVGFDFKSKRFVIIDSEKDPVVRIVAWNELKRRWAYADQEHDGEAVTYYDLYVLKPKYRVQTKADFSVKRAQYLRRVASASFVKHFDEYVHDMLYIASPSALARSEKVSMAEFLRRHRKMLIETVRYWDKNVTEAQLRRVLSNMQFVAETYGLMIRPEEERRAIASCAALLMTWATTHEPLHHVLYGK
jgi:hypothetical protein